MEKNSLVLYKHNPAIVTAIGDKIDIILRGGKSKKVRNKDIQLLHQGPISDFSSLIESDVDVEEGWELLQGEAPDLQVLAEIIYGDYTPVTAWQAYLLLNRTVYFKGTVDDIQVCSPEDVHIAKMEVDLLAEEAQKWESFLNRLKNNSSLPEDRSLFIDLENMAYKKSKDSKILKEFGKSNTPENAHKMLLEQAIWDYSVNPWPARMNLSVKSSTVPLEELGDEIRVDLTHLEAFAIDDEGNKDPDDAISIDGNKIWIHVADAAALVPPDSESDIEASNRGANLYLPELTSTMLPQEATDILGLGLNEFSPAFSFGLTFDENMDIDDIEIVLSTVKVTRLSYQKADTVLDKSPLKEIFELTSRFRANRERNGAVNINLPEVKLHVTDQGKVDIRVLPDLNSRNLVTDAMLMAGNCAALFAIRNNITVPFATQPKPEFDKMPDSDPASMFASRKFMKRSRMSTVPECHGGLGLDFYCRATSPLRRYPDLIVLQQLRNFITGKDLLKEEQVTERVALYESVIGSIVSAERFSNMHWKLVYLLQNKNWTGDALYVGKKEKQALYIIPSLAMEILMPVKKDLPLNGIIKIKSEYIDLANQQIIFKEIDQK
ncbi:MAG: ribonuclease catalytic domain-containing protein [Spirochaetaceae bacterium]|jgi:exoribonuclease-2|nr:ribonuclease catalytic domain-containing protein [Spirochaetaceae bacterium]